ncbi:MAG TPA: tRNA (adenosine(37)-N6)-threonylcarbamoyltransferase complex ATPase subunit type 1 TsaE [Candidatus Paceibacterota bacterium]|nr:tRNA (adenosine(37)-N6)-threonylcarbamoyltransferase complex ATPase subunit type 1 TsaE [Candidatus Paceibacterota bacterium]
MRNELRTPAELEKEAERFAGTLTPGDRAFLVTLSGELGAGKTAFAKAVARSLGIEDLVNSPTFVLEKIYQLPEGRPFKRLIHLDAYRLEKGSELALLGFDELMLDSGNLILLEWPEKVADALPVPAVRLSFVVQDDSHILSYG